ncbi:energy transducer TonB [Algoriphagus halophytocola]|uniref:energy transducer TonB n=1 Tax=Algoriphagus halophytocola TaxID=2991499 RepID=UPI0022DE3BD9|nr:energy transducer TonB [Algoriphagus sp. TR-M9]WBL42736.1 energy transducer TonB [Algoriphagus sp. TR-M9]
MKHLLTLIACLGFISTAAFAQSPAGVLEMNKLFSKNLKYSTEARNADIQGTVLLSIEIDDQGYPANVKVLEGNPILVEEVQDTYTKVEENWKPAYLGDKAFGQEYLLAVKFKMQEPQKDPRDPFTVTAHAKKKPVTIEDYTERIAESPLDAGLYERRANLYEFQGQKLLAEMDRNQVAFLKDKFLTQIVVVGYGPQYRSL